MRRWDIGSVLHGIEKTSVSAMLAAMTISSEKTFPISSFSPALQEMCRLEYRFSFLGGCLESDDDFDDDLADSDGDETEPNGEYSESDDPPKLDASSEPIDYVNRFSLTDDDIPALLEIAGWISNGKDIGDFEDAPYHAWKALSYLNPPRIVPRILEILNRVDWEANELAYGIISDSLTSIGIRSAKEARETGDASRDTIPLILEAMKEKERHSETRELLSNALREITLDFPDYRSKFLQILYDDLKELRIGCRNWYGEIVSELAVQKNVSPETIALMEKACREGYVDPYRYWNDEDVAEKLGFDYDNDEELQDLCENSERTFDILHRFQYCGETFPKWELQEARELRDWIIPSLIEVVRNATAYARHGIYGDGAVQFAVHLLAEFQAKEALPAVLDSLSFCGDAIHEYLYSDGLFESMPGIVYRLAGDDPSFYDQRIRDQNEPVALRRCLTESLKFLLAKEIISFETYGVLIRDYLELAIQSDNEVLATDLVCDICHTANPDFLPLARLAFEKELIEEYVISLEDVEKWLNAQEATIRLPDPNKFSDAEKALRHWRWFKDEHDTPVPSSSWAENRPHPLIEYATQDMLGEVLPPLSKKSLPKPEQKVGRNDPCPCGSGKKYKVCCGK